MLIWMTYASQNEVCSRLEHSKNCQTHLNRDREIKCKFNASETGKRGESSSVQSQRKIKEGFKREKMGKDEGEVIFKSKFVIQ